LKVPVGVAQVLENEVTAWPNLEELFAVSVVIESNEALVDVVLPSRVEVAVAVEDDRVRVRVRVLCSVRVTWTVVVLSSLLTESVAVLERVSLSSAVVVSSSGTTVLVLVVVSEIVYVVVGAGVAAGTVRVISTWLVTVR
jgi:hypothetical protein